MRYIELTEAEEHYLKDLYAHGANQIERRRSHCLLLSHKGYQIKELMLIFDVRYATVLDWFNNWEREGKAGIGIKPGRGVKKKLRQVAPRRLKELVDTHSRNLEAVVAGLEEERQVKVSVQTVQRFLKTSRLQLQADPAQFKAEA